MLIGLQRVLSPKNNYCTPFYCITAIIKHMQTSNKFSIYYNPLIKETITFISTKKAAKRLGISSSRLRVLANEGRVKHAFLDKVKGWQFPKTELTVSPGARGPAFGQSKAK